MLMIIAYEELMMLFRTNYVNPLECTCPMHKDFIRFQIPGELDKHIPED